MKKIYTYCGYIGIFGKQNVGKSTIINKIIGNKISITSRKPGTTRDNIFGIQTEKKYQFIYIDTPGITLKNETNTILKIKNNLELIIFVVNKTVWSEIDEMILNKIKKLFKKTILVINKIDCILNKNILLPYINKLQKKHNFIEIIPISAKNEENINILSKKVRENIPKSSHYFPKKYKTNVSKIFLISEIIREKIIRSLGQELPYLIEVKIDSYKVNKIGICYINAFILVQNERHKKIIIGRNAEKIKFCSISSRKDIEKRFYKKTHLNLWVKNNKKHNLCQ